MMIPDAGAKQDEGGDEALVPGDDTGAPPPGPPWDTPLEESALAFLDLEFTGLDAQAHHICELAIRRVRGGAIEGELSSLVRPASRVEASARIHGLTDDTLADAPPLSSLAVRVAALLDGAVLVGHGLAADVAFLRAAAARGELAPPPAFALDTLVLARRALCLPSYRLGALATALVLPAPTHRALGDVVTTEALFARLASELRAPTPRALWQVRAGETRASMRDDIREALARAATTTGHARVRYRVPHRAAIEDILAIRELTPPHVEGRLLRLRATRRLRGDRILWAEVAERPTP
jgi:DNA polymerase-3 subunit epsilon